jgi:hypothetical protein
MKHKKALTLLAGLLLTTVALSAAPSAQARQCSLAGLEGRWGYTYTGTLILPNGPVPVASVGSFKQDRDGNVSGSQTRNVGGASGVETSKGKVTVNDDCTGEASINVYDQSGNLLRSAEIAIVYVDGAGEARFIFKSLVQANGTNLPVVITANVKRISTAEEND